MRRRRAPTLIDWLHALLGEEGCRVTPPATLSDGLVTPTYHTHP